RGKDQRKLCDGARDQPRRIRRFLHCPFALAAAQADRNRGVRHGLTLRVERACAQTHGVACNNFARRCKLDSANGRFAELSYWLLLRRLLLQCGSDRQNGKGVHEGPLCFERNVGCPKSTARPARPASWL